MVSNALLQMLQVEEKAVIAAGGVSRVEKLGEDWVCRDGLPNHNGFIHGVGTQSFQGPVGHFLTRGSPFDLGATDGVPGS